MTADLEIVYDICVFSCFRLQQMVPARFIGAELARGALWSLGVDSK